MGGWEGVCVVSAFCGSFPLGEWAGGCVCGWVGGSFQQHLLLSAFHTISPHKCVCGTIAPLRLSVAGVFQPVVPGVLHPCTC